jgi:hypothetical protein
VWETLSGTCEVPGSPEQLETSEVRQSNTYRYTVTS